MCTTRLGAWSKLLLNVGVSVQNAAALCRCLTVGQLADTYTTLRAAYDFWCYLRSLVWGLRKAAAYLNFGVDAKIAQFDQIVVFLALLLADAGIERSCLGDKCALEERERARNLMQYACIDGRTLCTTEQRRICNGMNEVKEGDVIAAFQGASVLYVLRPVGTQYQLIGDAYVDGLLDGEAYEGLDPDEVDYDIELI
jgi:hypothetical protein